MMVPLPFIPFEVAGRFLDPSSADLTGRTLESIQNKDGGWGDSCYFLLSFILF
jgi:hypothetical protein